MTARDEVDDAATRESEARALVVAVSQLADSLRGVASLMALLTLIAAVSLGTPLAIVLWRTAL